MAATPSPKIKQKLIILLIIMALIFLALVLRLFQVEILKGLAAGDRVVVAGQHRIQRDGMPLRVDVADSAAAVPDGAASAAPPAARASAALPWAQTAAGPGPCTLVADAARR